MMNSKHNRERCYWFRESEPQGDDDFEEERHISTFISTDVFPSLKEIALPSIPIDANFEEATTLRHLNLWKEARQVLKENERVKNGKVKLRILAIGETGEKSTSTHLFFSILCMSTHLKSNYCFRFSPLQSATLQKERIIPQPCKRSLPSPNDEFMKVDVEKGEDQKKVMELGDRFAWFSTERMGKTDLV